MSRTVRLAAELARNVLRRARVRRSSKDPAWIVRLATALLGETAIAILPLRNPGYLQRADAGSYRILVSDRSPDAAFTIAHELGHWAIREVAGMRLSIPAEEERLANAFARALLRRTCFVRKAA